LRLPNRMFGILNRVQNNNAVAIYDDNRLSPVIS
jgi:hypothetical protein